MDPGPVVPTPYQRKLRIVLSEAHAAQHDAVKATVKAMHVAVDKNQYPALPALHAKLPALYAARIGPPPSSRADDR